MGQMVNGILYGCEAPVLPDDKYGEAIDGLVYRWEKAARIKHFSRGPHIRIESEGGKTLLGVWVAVGGSVEDGAPYFLTKCMPLDDVKMFYARAIARAEKLWDRFARHVKQKEGFDLDKPVLWLTPCEVA